MRTLTIPSKEQIDDMYEEAKKLSIYLHTAIYIKLNNKKPKEHHTISVTGAGLLLARLIKDGYDYENKRVSMDEWIEICLDAVKDMIELFESEE